MSEDIKLVFSILKSQVASLFFLLLVISAGVSFFMGEVVDGIIIAVIIFINTFLGFFQEFRASKASEKLLRLVENTVYVFRNGILQKIKVTELVVGDVVHLVPGAIAPVDIEVIESESAFIDDSMRTGETIPKEVKMGDKIFAGATVSSGKIVGHALNLLGKSSLSKYKEDLESVKKYSSFDIFTKRVIKYVFIASLLTLIISMFILVFLMGKYSLAHFFVFAIAMLVGVVPEMLPLIITIILTRESLTLAEHKAIVKRLSSLEGLGAIRFLLTDKTGTITENKLKVFAVSDSGDFWEWSNPITEGSYERNPMDSTYDSALNASIGKVATRPLSITHFEPFKHELGYEVFTLEDGSKIARGIIGPVVALSKSKDEKALGKAESYEKNGMRVIALSRGLAGEWYFVGFVAFHDPIKFSAEDSIKIAHNQGVSVKILTGDSKEVAMNVAEELHLIKTGENVIALDSVKVSSLSDRELLRAVVFAKCTPENKLELMDRYLALGPVAFLGDGINDALALKRADIGIAVDNASDIAKESADIILLEKDLSPILKSVSTGRRALRNILTYIMYTLAGNAGTFFSLLIASFFYPVLPMLPIQILLNNLLTDLPLMLIITDNVDKYALEHVPHFEPRKVIKRVVIFGIVSSVFDLIYFQLYKDVGVGDFQTGWFVLSILAELALILSIRSSRHIFKSPAVSVPLAFGIIVASILPFIFVYNSFLSSIFKFAKLPWSTIAVLFYMVLAYMFFNELAKYFMRKKNLYNKPVVPQPLFKNS